MPEHLTPGEVPDGHDEQTEIIYEIIKTMQGEDDAPDRAAILTAAFAAYFAEEAQKPPDSPFYYVEPDGTTRPATRLRELSCTRGTSRQAYCRMRKCATVLSFGVGTVMR